MIAYPASETSSIIGDPSAAEVRSVAARLPPTRPSQPSGSGGFDVQKTRRTVCCTDHNYVAQNDRTGWGNLGHLRTSNTEGSAAPESDPDRQSLSALVGIRTIECWRHAQKHKNASDFTATFVNRLRAWWRPSASWATAGPNPLA